MVADIELTQSFYERAIGLKWLDRVGDVVSLGAGEATVVELVGDPAAPQRPRGTTGLFHHAILVPDRSELARSLKRIIGAGCPLGGASDHLVSEALYVRDPEGNGIEIYRDLPRERWQTRGEELAMDSLPLDLEALLAEAPPGEPSDDGGVAPGTRLGHIHLNVADLAETEAFYAGLLGFQVTVRSYPGALFFAAGGYHHHIGANIWAGEGAPPPPAGSRGLRWFEIVLPSGEEFDAVAGRLRAAGRLRDDGGALHASDPSGNEIVLTVAD